MLQALPETVRAIAVLDRTKEPGAQAEPLYLDVMTALARPLIMASAKRCRAPLRPLWAIIQRVRPGVRTGVFNELSRAKPKPRFTWAFMMTSLISRCHYRKNTLPGNAKLEALFTVWEATAAYPPRKIN
ncbi:pyruvate-flavodoxin oxidoreductase [Salmonella enterica subsp. enterica]|uniref:Pyruvate-flavodoxin oxidoreductase n=1 Tax=Salmonella enterica I TaxID=59201 RepID=A0A379WT76_SALET|nr:pyruvate-flavodoxin oxidoreductase [Salmonella enterica subsp. enterica]